jgi:hypothetical protein
MIIPQLFNMNEFPPLPRAPRKMDANHLNLLASFHFVGGGLTGIGLLFLCAGLLAGCGKPKVDPVAAGKALVASHQAAPLDLATNYMTPAAYFDKITSFPAWRTVPRGPQVFDGVPLEIGGMICLWGENNEKQLHLKFPEARTGIPLNRKFETLYVYHGTFFSEDDGVPVCAVVFRYDDGSAVTNQLRYGEDMLDWGVNRRGGQVIAPSASRSELAWVGGSFSPDRPQAKAPIRFCLTAVENPQPDVTVGTVDLLSCKSKAAACILALTPGKAGLMKPAKEHQ